MAFGSQKRRGFADGGTVDVTISGATPTPPPPFIGANSSVPALTAANVAKYPTLPAMAPPTQPALTPQPFSANAANVPVGGNTGTPNSPALGQIGANGIPIGSPGPPTIGAQSSLTAPVTAARGGMMKKGGMAGGGIPTSEAMDPWYTRSEERGMNMQPQGLVKSNGAGRTDVHSINVPAGSYVLPADVVSGLGEGNTLAGSSVIDRMMNTLPFGIQGKKIGKGSGPPRAPAGPPLSEEHPYGMTEGLPAGEAHARGGKAKAPQSGAVPIIVAGGEHILYPQTIIQKFGSLQKGHAVLDKFVVGTRKQTIGEMRKLKGPKK